MPKLDGVSATSLIRKFDPRTPIISMTSNSKPHDILYYFSQGMNDILPKPFTKEGLLGMLEKHLIHLKLSDVIRNYVPRGVGIPPLNDENFSQAIVISSQTFNSQTQPQMMHQDENSQNQEGRVNPLAGMGVSDEQYTMLVHNYAATGGFDTNGELTNPMAFAGFLTSSHDINGSEKRPLDDGADRDQIKRGRFEIVE